MAKEFCGSRDCGNAVLHSINLIALLVLIHSACYAREQHTGAEDEKETEGNLHLTDGWSGVDCATWKRLLYQMDIRTNRLCDKYFHRLSLHPFANLLPDMTYTRPFYATSSLTGRLRIKSSFTSERLPNDVSK